MSEVIACGGFRGYVSREHTVWCGICGNWAQLAEPKLPAFRKAVIRMGWKSLRKRGWVCPKCLPNQASKQF